MTSYPQSQTECVDGRWQQVWPLPLDEAYLQELLSYIFEQHWQQIIFGPIIEGAAYEIRCPCAPRKISLFDGYLTVHFGSSHFHLCIGEHQGSPANPTPQALRQRRRTSRAELVRSFDGGADADARAPGAPLSWQLRMFNGDGTPQLNIFFPNPFLTDEDGIAEQPDWSRLAVWQDISARYLGLPVDPLDRMGKGFGRGG